jgi:predicted transposase/invertase (TIGR01784 family)
MIGTWGDDVTRYMDLKVDFAFKQLFGTEGNESILLALLNAILKLPEEEQIASLTILNSEQLREHAEDKLSVLDIYARTEKNEYVNIEIQVTNKYDMVKRTLYYWSRIYTSQIKKNNVYSFSVVRERVKVFTDRRDGSPFCGDA